MPYDQYITNNYDLKSQRLHAADMYTLDLDELATVSHHVTVVTARRKLNSRDGRAIHVHVRPRRAADCISV